MKSQSVVTLDDFLFTVKVSKMSVGTCHVQSPCSELGAHR